MASHHIEHIDWGTPQKLADGFQSMHNNQKIKNSSKKSGLSFAFASSSF
jgi:hypothetical protein